MASVEKNPVALFKYAKRNNVAGKNISNIREYIDCTTKTVLL